MKRIRIYTNDGDKEIRIKDNGPNIVEVTNGQKKTLYQLRGTKFKQIIGRKHKETTELMIQRSGKTQKTGDSF